MPEPREILVRVSRNDWNDMYTTDSHDFTSEVVAGSYITYLLNKLRSEYPNSNLLVRIEVEHEQEEK